MGYRREQQQERDLGQGGVEEGGKSTERDEGDGLTSLVLAVHTDLCQSPQKQTRNKGLDRSGSLRGPSKQDLEGVGRRDGEREEASAGSSRNRRLLQASRS